MNFLIILFLTSLIIVAISLSEAESDLKKNN